MFAVFVSFSSTSPTVNFTMLTSANIRFTRCKFIGGEASCGWWSRPSHIEYRDCTFEIAGSAYLRIPVYTVGKIVVDRCKVAKTGDKGASIIDVHDLRPQPPDNQVGSVVVRGCTFGAGIKKGILVSGFRKGASAKKVTVEASGNKFSEESGAILASGDILATWKVAQ